MSDLTLVIRYENGNLKIVSKEAEKELAKAGKKSGKKFSDEFSKEIRLEKPFRSPIKRIKSSIFDLTKSFTEFKISGLAAFAAVGVTAFKATQAAIEQENAVNRLNAALKVSGDFSLQSSNGFQELASELQKVTRFGDETILNQIALAKSFGATNEQAADVAKVAVDLAEAFDIDLTSATRNAAKTLGGFAGELGEVIPELKDLSKEQLRAGEGIKLLGDRFAGTAAERVDTFSGAVQQSANAWGDLLEGLGQFITDNPVVLNGIQNTTNFVATLGDAIKFAAKEFNQAFGKKDQIEPLKRLDAEILQVFNRIQTLKKATGEGGADQFTTQGKILRKELQELERLEKGLLRRRKLVVADSLKGNEDRKKTEFKTEAEILAEKTRVSQQLGQIGLDRVQQIEAQQLQQQEILAAARELEIISQMEFLNRKAELERQFTEQLAAEESKRLQNAKVTAANIGAAFVDLAKNYKLTAGDISKTLFDLSVRGFGRAFQNIGAAIASGENVNQAFVDSVKATASEAASVFGDYYIKSGIAQLAETGGAKGAETVAAGFGLKALAGALGASAAGGAPAGAGGTTAGSTSFVEPDTTDEDFAGELEATSSEPQTVLNINVEGNVVDNEAFVRNLVQEIGEEGGKQGLVFDNFATV